jgi:hypothetical protein
MPALTRAPQASVPGVGEGAASVSLSVAEGSIGPVPSVDRILDGLNPAQREAASVLRGPVAILAGAGTGKTTTITRRIANQVASGAFAPAELLAVTFTERAARELKTRLRMLSVDGVEARTFHAAALSQLSRLWSAHTGSALPEILDSKAPLIAKRSRTTPQRRLRESSNRSTTCARPPITGARSAPACCIACSATRAVGEEWPKRR